MGVSTNTAKNDANLDCRNLSSPGERLAGGFFLAGEW